MEYPYQQVFTRMPLAEAVLWLWRWMMSEERLQAVWARHRGRCYERLLSFALMVQLVADALLQYRGSGRRSVAKKQATEGLATSYQAVYGKLGRLPVAVSQGLVAVGTQALGQVWPGQGRRPLPPSLQQFEVVILDGKTIKRVAKRLLPLRGRPGGLVGRRAWGAMAYRSGMAGAMQAHPDGDANEVGLVAALVPQVRQVVPGPRLWLGDRAFCDLEQPLRFTATAGDHFVLRYHPKVKFHPDPTRSPHSSPDAPGSLMVERWGWLGSARDPRRCYVRQVTLELADKVVTLVTDRLDAEHYPAAALCAVYRERWGIEQMFQQVTEVFGRKGLIGGRPHACIFQLAFCLLLYNMLQVVRAYVAAGQAREVETASTEKLFEDVQRELIAWTVVVEAQATIGYFAALPPPDDLRTRLQARLGATWSPVWLKAPKQKRRRPPSRPFARTHHSVYRLLQASPPHPPPLTVRRPQERC